MYVHSRRMHAYTCTGICLHTHTCTYTCATKATRVLCSHNNICSTYRMGLKHYLLSTTYSYVYTAHCYLNDKQNKKIGISYSQKLFKQVAR